MKSITKPSFLAPVKLGFIYLSIFHAGSLLLLDLLFLMMSLISKSAVNFYIYYIVVSVLPKHGQLAFCI